MTKARNIANTTLTLGSTLLSLANTTTSVSGLSLVSPTINGAASSKSLVIKSNATSPGNALEIQNSSATPLFSISASGLPYFTTTSLTALDMYSEAGANNSSFLPTDVWADKIRFRVGTYESSTDGTTNWTVGAFQPEVVDGRMDTTVSLLTSTKGHRWTWAYSDIGWSTLKFVRITTAYISPGTTYDLIFESSVDGVTWTNRGSWTNISGYIGKRLFTNGDIAGDPYVRVTIKHNSSANTIRLEGIELLSYRPGDQGGSINGIESNLPLTWGGYKNTTFQATNPQFRPITVVGLNLSTTVTNAVGSGTTVTYTAANNFVAGQTVTITGINPSAYNLTNVTIASASYNQFTVTNAATGTFVTGGTATVSQSGDLQQWQNNAGTALAKIDSLGNLTAASIIRTSGTSSQFLKADGTVDSTSYAPLASPTFTGTPLSTTAAVDTNTTQIATTAYVVGQGYAKLASPIFTGTPAAPTAAVDTNTTQIATTAYVIGQSYLKTTGSFNLGTTSITLNRASGAQTLTGISIDGNAGTVTNGIYTTSSFNLGTTSIALNRASGSQTLTGISIDGNAGTVTNGVYTNASTTITGTVTAQSFIPSSSTAPTNGIYLPATNIVGIASNSTQRMTFDANGSINLFGQTMESVTTSATAANTTVTYDVMTNKNVLYYTTNASANWTFNVRGNSSTSLNTLMAIGQSLTLVFMVTNGATAYYQTAFQIDGTSVTPKWFGGTAPTAGNVNSIDLYTYNIIKTGASTYTVLASLNKYA